MTRSMLKTKGMPKEFWAEAVMCSVYVQNRCPHQILGQKTPQEFWSGHKPNVGHLRVFGSIAYAHVPDQQRKKLDDKSKKLIFVGYDDKSKAYRLYNPAENKVVISRDVQFDEENKWEWSQEENSRRNDEPEILIPIIGDLRGKGVITEEVEARGNENPEPRRGRNEEGESSGSGSRTSEINLENSEEPRNPRYRSIEDIYNQGEVHMVCLLADAENITFPEAINDEKWVKAMDEEIGAIEKNQTWEVAELPKGHKTIGVKWVFKKKLNPKGEVERYKARLVAKRYR